MTDPIVCSLDSNSEDKTVIVESLVNTIVESIVDAAKSPITSEVETANGNNVAGKINETNVGHRLLCKMGWKGSGGIGKHEDGIHDPIEAKGHAGSCRHGIGLKPGESSSSKSKTGTRIKQPLHLPWEPFAMPPPTWAQTENTQQFLPLWRPFRPPPPEASTNMYFGPLPSRFPAQGIQPLGAPPIIVKKTKKMKKIENSLKLSYNSSLCEEKNLEAFRSLPQRPWEVAAEELIPGLVIRLPTKQSLAKKNKMSQATKKKIIERSCNYMNYKLEFLETMNTLRSVSVGLLINDRPICSGEGSRESEATLDASEKCFDILVTRQPIMSERVDYVELNRKLNNKLNGKVGGKKMERTTTNTQPSCNNDKAVIKDDPSVFMNMMKKGVLSRRPQGSSGKKWGTLGKSMSSAKTTATTKSTKITTSTRKGKAAAAILASPSALRLKELISGEEISSSDELVPPATLAASSLPPTNDSSPSKVETDTGEKRKLNSVPSLHDASDSKSSSSGSSSGSSSDTSSDSNSDDDSQPKSFTSHTNNTPLPAQFVT